MAASLLFTNAPNPFCCFKISQTETPIPLIHLTTSSSSYSTCFRSTTRSIRRRFPSLSSRYGACLVFNCVSPLPPSSSISAPKTKLYISGLSFRTTQESLRNAFQNFGQLIEVNLVMDKLANRPRGFAFLRYATEEESQKAIEGMHGKFLDGRVIFVEVAKPRSELRQGLRKIPRQY